MRKDRESSAALALEMDRALTNCALVRLREIIFRAGEDRHRDLAARILRVAQSVGDERTLENAAWALGKLAYRPAQPVLIHLLLNQSVSVVRAASWALGEIGCEESRESLRRCYGRHDDEELRQVIGGALKKIAGLPVRAFAGSVEKRLRTPVSDRPKINSLVTHLEELDFQLDRSEVLRLRQELQELDGEYYSLYMKYRSQRSAALQILASDRVYGHS